MRLFFAIALEDSVRATAAHVAEDLQRRLAAARNPRAIKWVERENLHVTMRFLGEVDDARARVLIDGTRQPLAHPAFDLTLGGAGAFPPAGTPRVAWIGVARGEDSTRAVFQLLEQRVAALRFEPESRAYTPHVTLGRVREMDREGGGRLREWLAGVPGELGSERVEQVTLYRSHLSSAGPRYEVVATVPLS